MTIKFSLIDITKDSREETLLITFDYNFDGNIVDYVSGLYIVNNQQKIKISKDLIITNQKIKFNIDKSILYKIDLSKPNDLALVFQVDNSEVVKIVNIEKKFEYQFTVLNKDLIIKSSSSKSLVIMESKNSEVDISVSDVFISDNILELIIKDKQLFYEIDYKNNVYFYNQKLNEKVHLKLLNMNQQTYGVQFEINYEKLFFENWKIVILNEGNTNALTYAGESKEYFLEADQSLATLWPNLSHEIIISLNSSINQKNFIFDEFHNENNYFELTIKPDFEVNDYVKITLIAIERSTNIKQELCEGKTIDNKLFFKVNYQSIEIIESNEIFDILVQYERPSGKLLRKIFVEDNYLFLPQTAFNEKAIKRVRLYTNADGYLSLLVEDNAILMSVSNVKINESSSSISLNMSQLVRDGISNFIGISVLSEDDKKQVEYKLSSLISRIDDNTIKLKLDKVILNELSKLGQKNLLFKVYFEFNGGIYNKLFEFNEDDINDKKNVIKYPLLTFDKDSQSSVELTYNYANQLKLMFNFFSEVQISSVKFEKNTAEIDVEISNITKAKDHIHAALYDFRNDQYIDINTRGTSTGIKIYFDYEELKSNISQNDFALKPVLLIDKGETTLCVDIPIDLDLDFSLNTTFSSTALKVENDNYFAVFVDRLKAQLLIEARPKKDYEKTIGKMKNIAAKLLAMIASVSGFKKNIWVISENLGEVAQDNGYAFFKYCMNKPNNKLVYYVTKKDNKNMDKLLEHKKNLIYYDTFMHYFYYHLSRFLVVAHGIRDTSPSFYHNKIRFNTKDIIYLQHGIIAMKKLGFNSKSYNNRIQKFVVSSTHEKRILINKMNFNEEQIMVTGLSRFDDLIDTSHQLDKKQIFVMPTWREWILNNEVDFIGSDFFKHYKALLTNEKLKKVLREENIVLKFYPHIEIQRNYIELFEDFASDHIKIIKSGEEDIKSLIMDSSLMITDYSSVCFDFNYLEKPTIFYHFDLNEYLSHRGAFVDLTQDLVGEVAYKSNELVDLIEKSVCDNFKYEFQFKEKSKKYYNYKDKKNNQRIFEEIKKIQ
ncbi:CDP-glycerol glycerophosphotransferase (TagB/SpsB family) [Streptohalobacillus salinus]|uniref:CDP-glycerol glycerophosphotransferase (TagB/SpsB family) n=1 Tax=Streptohalobacillus salinus TaxID=621096 RepID=A0A2V3WEJ8_9BACI|nr:CDP-glycerol glycerophosphotransferase family protein [Streptohalobacillus salinus]PXW92028.1 CDP-glycerol glycerophosphotransferase (TagB/SpsB family) [Streptohalobacillus salinus]